MHVESRAESFWLLAFREICRSEAMPGKNSPARRIRRRAFLDRSIRAPSTRLEFRRAIRREVLVKVGASNSVAPI